jgi:hypothetical protein
LEAVEAQSSQLAKNQAQAFLSINARIEGIANGESKDLHLIEELQVEVGKLRFTSASNSEHIGSLDA